MQTPRKLPDLIIVIGALGVLLLLLVIGWRSGIIVIDSLVTSNDVILAVNDHYWTKPAQVNSLRIGPNEIKAEVIEQDVLVVDITATNSLSSNYLLDCYVSGAEGGFYLDTLQGDIQPGERLFIPTLEPHETRRGKMAFIVPHTTQELWVHCGKNIAARIQ